MSYSTRNGKGFFRADPVVYNGIPVAKDRPWWQRVFGIERQRYKDIETYEAGLVNGLNTHVDPSAHVVIVGTGFGVTVVLAAKRTGKGGQVTAYEGSAKCMELTKETISRNEVEAEITLIHGIVGEEISVYGSGTSAPVISASDLPECDVLELDCEGAELKILTEMRIRPKVILVETHGSLGAKSDSVRALLVELGYDVDDLGVAEPDRADFCNEHDIRVLSAQRKVT